MIIFIISASWHFETGDVYSYSVHIRKCI